MSLPVIATWAFLLLQTAKGSIEGTVLSSTTNRPIAGAQITAFKMQTGPGAGRVVVGAVVGGTAGGGLAPQVGPPARLSASTDSSGHFIFQDLEPGTYSLQAAA